MKQFSILLAASFLCFSTYSFAESPHQLAAAMPIDAVNVPDVEDANPSASADIDPTIENESVLINEQLKATPKTDVEQNSDLYYTISVSYPQIEGNKLTQTAEQFNQLIADLIKDRVQQFKNSLKLDVAHMNTLPEEARKNTFKIDYDLDAIHPDAKTTIISVRFSIEGMQAGRPHPYHAHQVLNFDLNTGKVLELADLFKKNAPYLTTIATYSRDKLTQKLNDKWLIDEGTKPTPKNFSNWNLETDGILITFEEYQVAPYVYGPQEVEIPFSALSKWLAASAPVPANYKLPAANEPKKVSAKPATHHKTIPMHA